MTSEPSRASATSERRRSPISREPAFVLHSWPCSESSVLLDVFTRGYGRQAAKAKGARRLGSCFRGLLEPFAPLAVSLSGGADEVRLLKTAEWLGGMAPLSGTSLFSGFYMNELLMRFIGREDPVPDLFGAYFETLRGLGQGRDEALLRRFEVQLLESAGYAVTVPLAAYVRVFEGHLVDAATPGEGTVIASDTARAIFSADFSDPATVRAAKPVLRQILSWHAAGRPLATRGVVQEISRMSGAFANSRR